MENQKKKNPLWAWFVLIAGGLFLLQSLPGMLLTIAIPIWKPDEFSFFTVIYIPIVLGILVVTIWGLKKAFSAIKDYQQVKNTGISAPQPKPIILSAPAAKYRFGHGL